MIIFNALTLCVRWRENLELVEVAIGFSIAFNVWFIVEVREGREERRGREGGRRGEGREGRREGRRGEGGIMVVFEWLEGGSSMLARWAASQ